VPSGSHQPTTGDISTNTCPWMVTDASENFKDQTYKHYEAVSSAVKIYMAGTLRPRTVHVAQGHFNDSNAAPRRAYFNATTSTWSQAPDTNINDSDDLATIDLFYEQMFASKVVHPFASTNQHVNRKFINFSKVETTKLGVDSTANADTNPMQAFKDLFIRHNKFCTIRDQSFLAPNSANTITTYIGANAGNAAPVNVNMTYSQSPGIYNWDRTKDKYLFIWCSDNYSQVGCPSASFFRTDVGQTRAQDGIFVRNSSSDPCFDIKVDNTYRVHYSMQ